MTELKDLENKLKNISDNDWNRLFSLITEIEKSNSFGEMNGGDKDHDGTNSIPYMRADEIVDNFLDISYEIGIMPVFDWPGWTEGREIINDKQTDYSKLDAMTLCKLLTVIVRADRFNEGFLVSCFEEGIILNILKGLKRNIIR